MRDNFDANHNRRMANEGRYLARLERLELQALPMIGELCREGRTVYYVYPDGGRYREGTRTELIAFLIRNKYVRLNRPSPALIAHQPEACILVGCRNARCRKCHACCSPGQHPSPSGRS